MKTCPICQSENLILVDDIIMDIDGYYFIIKGTRCKDCHEEFFDEKEGQKMITIAKRYGI
jgi:YgiT-type zinc finger domain-containing protein